jgi:hypothetical protein
MQKIFDKIFRATSANQEQSATRLQSLGTSLNIPSDYPKDTPGQLVMDCTARESLLLYRGFREGMAEARRSIGGLQLAANADPELSLDILRLLLESTDETLDFEKVDMEKVLSLALGLYRDPENAHIPIRRIFVLARDIWGKNLSGQEAENEILKARER